MIPESSLFKLKRSGREKAKVSIYVHSINIIMHSLRI